MKLDPKKFNPDESFSNHAVQGYSHPDCPIDKGCFAQATGFGGGILKLCNRFNVETSECSEEVIEQDNEIPAVTGPITITLSLREAKSIQSYLIRSYFRYKDEVTNLIAQEAIYGNKYALQAIDARTLVIDKLHEAIRLCRREG